MASTKIEFNGDAVLRFLIGILFVCIGVEGIADIGSNALYRAIDQEAVAMIVGIIILVSGILLVVPMFIKGIKQSFVKASMAIVLAVWILVIIFSDFVYGFKGTHGSEWFTWIEGFIYHLLILACVFKVSAPALKPVVGKSSAKKPAAKKS